MKPTRCLIMLGGIDNNQRCTGTSEHGGSHTVHTKTEEARGALEVPAWEREMDFRQLALRFQRDYPADTEALNKFVSWWFAERHAYALAAHVAACGARQNTDDGWRRGPSCGDGWYCDDAQKLTT